MINFAVRVVLNRLPALADSYRNDGDRHCQDTIDAVVQRAKSLCPVDTGALRNSIERTGAGQAAKLVVGMAYGIYVEFGTINMRAQPFIRPAVEQTRAAYIQGWKDILKGTGMRAGSITVLPSARYAGPGKGGKAT